MVDMIRKAFDFNVVIQAIVVAGITAMSSGYVIARVVESKLEFMAKETARIEVDVANCRKKIEEIALIQASKISEASMTHKHQDTRLDKLETKCR